MKNSPDNIQPVVPSGKLLKLKLEQIKPSTNNPRTLFDPEPLHDLRESIKQHGVLVPITVYQLKGQDKFAILDGERRCRCCHDLKKEGIDVIIPANIVEPPNKIAGLIYMFSIHNFREAWELMPTALSLKIVIDELKLIDNQSIIKITGLSEPQIERCKILLEYPIKYQNLSLEQDPKERIPSNFWIELYPVLNLCEKELKGLIKKIGRDGICDKLVQKYRNKKIKSVIHFRKIMEAYEFNDADTRKEIIKSLQDYILNVDLETRAVFDRFTLDPKRIKTAIGACSDFISTIKKLKIDYTLDREELKDALKKVKVFAEKMLTKLEGSDAPEE